MDCLNERLKRFKDWGEWQTQKLQKEPEKSKVLKQKVENLSKTEGQCEKEKYRTHSNASSSNQ
jgi:hypothetical protein